MLGDLDAIICLHRHIGSKIAIPPIRSEYHQLEGGASLVRPLTEASAWPDLEYGDIRPGEGGSRLALDVFPQDWPPAPQQCG